MFLLSLIYEPIPTGKNLESWELQVSAPLPQVALKPDTQATAESHWWHDCSDTIGLLVNRKIKACYHSHAAGFEMLACMAVTVLCLARPPWTWTIGLVFLSVPTEQFWWASFPADCHSAGYSQIIKVDFRNKTRQRPTPHPQHTQFRCCFTLVQHPPPFTFDFVVFFPSYLETAIIL